MTSTRASTRKSTQMDSDEYTSSSSESESGSSSHIEEEAKQPEPRQHQRQPTTTPQRQPTTTPRGEDDEDEDGEGLTETETVQLATDIVEAGGIDNIGRGKYQLATLLDEKGDHYPLHIEGKLRQIQNKVNFWKSKENGRAEYNRYVLGGQPTPSPARRTQTPGSRQRNRAPGSQSRNRAPGSQRSSRASGRQTHTTEQTNPPSSPPPIQRTVYTGPSEEHQHYSRERQVYVRPFSPTPSKILVTMNDTQRNHLNAASIVNVDPDHPEKNGDMMIYSLTNHQGTDNVLRNGYIMEFQSVDHRWITLEAETYEAWVVAPNEVLVKRPSTSFTYIHAPGDEKIGKEKSDFKGSVIDQATDVPRNAILNDETRQYKYTWYIFPHDLDNNAFSPDSENGKIKAKVVPLMTTFTHNNTDITVCNSINIEFMIAKFEEKKRVVTSSTKTNTLADQLQSMSI